MTRNTSNWQSIVLDLTERSHTHGTERSFISLTEIIITARKIMIIGTRWYFLGMQAIG